MTAAPGPGRRAFVTGGTGFVGGHVVRELRARDWQVAALHRAGSATDALAGPGVELIRGDITDPASLREAMPEGVDAVFHVAASLNMWSRNNARQDAVNIDGTRHVVEAALARRAGIFVHTSTVSAYGHPSQPITESTPSAAGRSSINYERSKWLAEQEVRQGMERGLRAVIINPCAVLGPGDRHGWAQFFGMIKAGRIKGIPPGSLTINDVREVASAHVAAVDRGRDGANYLLGGETVSHRQMLQTMAELLGVELRARVAPAAMLRIISRIDSIKSRFTGRPPELTPEMAELLCADIVCGSDLAERELGYRPAPLRPCLEASLRWLQENDLI